MKDQLNFGRRQVQPELRGHDAPDFLAVDAVRRRPVAAGGIVAALALFLAREPLIDLAGKALGSKKTARKRTRKTSEKVESE